MELEANQQQQKVRLSLSLSTSPPHTLSVHDANPSVPLKLIASIKQISSPFPDRAVTLMTKYTCLDTTESDGAFFIRAMNSPQISDPDPQCPAPELPMRPIGVRVNFIRVSGDPDLLKRPEEDAFNFVTVPPVGQGHGEVTFELTPANLLKRLGDKGESVEAKLLQFLRPGDSYKITPKRMRMSWWTFGSLEGEDRLRSKKIARWSLPKDLPLVREPGDDETEEMSHRLVDPVDWHDVNRLSSRSAIDGEQRPEIGKMRREGWVFGEPESGLELVLAEEGKEAIFTITE